MSETRNNRQQLIRLLILQILTIPAVAMIFRLQADRETAGLIAGSWFCAFSAYMIWSFRRLPSSRYTQVSLNLSAVYLLGSVYLLGYRLMHRGMPFEDFNLLGFSGPQYHRVMESLFMAVLISTVLTLVKTPKQNATL